MHNQVITQQHAVGRQRALRGNASTLLYKHTVPALHAYLGNKPIDMLFS